MHLESVKLCPENAPNRTLYPFNLPAFQKAIQIVFNSAVTFFVGENGSGKSTLLEAIARRSGIHIWQDQIGRRVAFNPFEKKLAHVLEIEWSQGPVPGSRHVGLLRREVSAGSVSRPIPHVLF